MNLDVKNRTTAGSWSATTVIQINDLRVLTPIWLLAKILWCSAELGGYAQLVVSWLSSVRYYDCPGAGKLHRLLLAPLLASMDVIIVPGALLR